MRMRCYHTPVLGLVLGPHALCCSDPKVGSSQSWQWQKAQQHSQLFVMPGQHTATLSVKAAYCQAAR
jgi:hypothetical protein